VLSLIGTVPAPISSAPLVILIYVVLILMLASALASVLLQDTRYVLGAFTATMLLVALLYLTVAPALLFAVQLLVFTVVSAVLVIGLLRRTAGLDPIGVGPFSREWIAGGVAAAVLLAILLVVVAATAWPVRPCCSLGVEDFGSTLTNGYVVGLATAVVLLASAALGASLMLRAAPVLPLPRGRSERGPAEPGSRRIRRSPRP
jgi:NADH:ubiquinone oxidoreductase subunit 6 (subunit J)